MISVKDLRIAFDGRTIVDGIDFFVPEGATFVIMGKNGSGKSVILKALSGLIECSGTIEINGVNIHDLYRDRFRMTTGSAQQFRVGYVFQKGGLFDSMNVFDNVAFGLRRMNVSEDSIKNMVVNSLARVGLKGSEGKLVSELSGGMQKRVGLARVICLNPNVIFFDDPTAGLDPILTDSIADLILEIKNSLNTTSIVVTHDAMTARKVGDSIALLYNGRIVHVGGRDAFFSMDDTYARQFLEGDIEGPIDIF